MSYSNFFSDFNPKLNTPLAPYTTWKVGGPAEILVEVSEISRLVEILEIATKNQVPVTILGGGSNVLISDKGLDGLVIINKTSQILFPDLNRSLDSSLTENKESLERKEGRSKNFPGNESNPEIEASDFDLYIPHRHIEVDPDFYTFADLEFEESGKLLPVTFDSGVKIPMAIAQTLKHGFTGLQWFAGIPSTIGGALYNNIHGGTRHFSEYFSSALIYIPGEGVVSKPASFFQFGYDQSILRTNPEIIILQVTLNLYFSTSEKIAIAKNAAQQWTLRKRRQPRVSAGCNFKNISLEKQKELGFPTPSVGWLIEKKFEWSGKKLGGAFISPGHHNFIENDGTATASDIYNLMQEIKEKAKTDYGLELEEEIKLLGRFE